jgi:hypothetical protein
MVVAGIVMFNIIELIMEIVPNYPTTQTSRVPKTMSDGHIDPSKFFRRIALKSNCHGPFFMACFQSLSDEKRTTNRLSLIPLNYVVPCRPQA